MGHINIKAGTNFNDWTVLDKPPFKKQGHWFYFCKCVCGTIRAIYTSNLKTGRAVRCRDCQVRRMTTHPPAYKDGGKYRRLRRSWTDMHSRCYNLKDFAYARYGGRGLIVCPEWFSFPKFKKWALEHQYTNELTIERIDNSGNYEPSNCKWATYKEQNRNRRSNTYYTAFGESKIIPEWAEDPRCPVSLTTLQNRLTRDNWNTEHAITFPKNPGLSYGQMKERYL